MFSVILLSLCPCRFCNDAPFSPSLVAGPLELEATSPYQWRCSSVEVARVTANIGNIEKI